MKSSLNSTETLQPANRLEWIDYAKGIAIILVVYRHILIGMDRAGITYDIWLKNANEIVYSFRMPLFFIISGLFVAKSITKRTNSSFVKYKFDTILFPYLVWGVIQISIQFYLSNYTNATRGWIDYGYLIVQPKAIDQLWYLYALFNVSILFYFFYQVLKLNQVMLLVLGLVFFGLTLYVKEYSLIHDVLYFFIFFVIGHMIGEPWLLSGKYQSFMYSYKPFIILFPFFWLTQWYWLYHQDMNLYIFAIIALLGTGFVFSISFLLAKYNTMRFLKIVGKHSLQIYLMHLLIISAVRMVAVNILDIKQPVAILLIGWTLGTIIPIWVFQSIKNTPLKYLFSLKK